MSAAGGLNEQDFAKIESAIYEAAFVPELWPNVLQGLADVSDAIGGVMFSVTEYRSQWTSSLSIRDVMQEFVEGGWASKNTRMANGLRKGLHLLPRFVTEADYFEAGEQASDPLYTDFFKPRGFGASAGIVPGLPHGDLVCISVEKAEDTGPVSAKALAQLDGLRPHLVRSAILTARIGLERIRTAVDTLAQLGFAAAAVGLQGKVVVANEAFESANGPWTTRGGDRIVFRDANVFKMVQIALEEISGTSGVRSIPLREQDSPVRHVLHVVPIRGLAQDIFTGAVAILVVTSAIDKSGATTLLQVLFDLTAAESQLARKIANGASLQELVTSEGRSPHTLRSQLKSVFAKTGCSRQAELARLLAQLLPPAM